MTRFDDIEAKIEAAQALVDDARQGLQELREYFEAILSETTKIAELTSVISEL